VSYALVFLCGVVIGQWTMIVRHYFGCWRGKERIDKAHP
jgi:hypothetical protein